MLVRAYILRCVRVHICIKQTQSNRYKCREREKKEEKAKETRQPHTQISIDSSPCNRAAERPQRDISLPSRIPFPQTPLKEDRVSLMDQDKGFFGPKNPGDPIPRILTKRGWLYIRKLYFWWEFQDRKSIWRQMCDRNSIWIKSEFLDLIRFLLETLVVFRGFNTGFHTVSLAILKLVAFLEVLS